MHTIRQKGKTAFLCLHSAARTSTTVIGETTQVRLYHFGDHIGRHISTRKEFYEFDILRYVADNIPPGGTWIDAGACIGTHSVFFALFCADKVIAIEPEPDNYRLLEANITDNNLDNIIAVNAGISIDGRRMKTTPDPDNCGNTTMQDSPAGLATLTPENIIDEPIRFLKIDCENMTTEVLSAFLPIINQDRPYILIEAPVVPPSLARIGYTEMMNFRAGTRTYLLKP